MGAQIVGRAARKFKKLSSKVLPIIVGFDPANPCFNDNSNGIKCISASDAKFVMIIHSNIDVCGEHGPDGTIDIYPNGEESSQPGCSLFKLGPDLDPSCSHHRCLNYYAESFFKGNENNLIAYKCKNMKELSQKQCKGEKIPVGINTPRNITGIYYLPVNPSEPYGKHASNKHFCSTNLKCYACSNKKKESFKEWEYDLLTHISTNF